jgi:hypothetical protein
MALNTLDAERSSTTTDGTDLSGVSVGAAGRRIDHHLVLRAARYSLLVFALSRVLATIAIYFGTRIAPGKDMYWSFLSWDSGWYLRLIENGYPHIAVQGHGAEAQNTIAFFPLFGILGRAVGAVTGFSAMRSGIIVALLGGAVTVVLLWLLAEQLLGERVADRAVALFCFFPASFCMLLPYAEGVMLAFATGCLLALVRRRWLVAGICAGFATATRPSALVLGACCLWAAVSAIRRDREWKALIAPALAPSGTLAYFTFLWHHTGDFFAWSHVEQAGWEYTTADTLKTFMSYQFALRDPLYDINLTSTTLSFVVAAIGFLMLSRWKPRAELTIFAAGICLMALFFGGPYSKLRYVWAAFPLAIAAAHWARTELRFLALFGTVAVALGIYVLLLTNPAPLTVP